eukprot:15634050-Heterocapsa_arctica.AAC.1
MEDSEGDAWTLENNTTRKKNPPSNHKNPGTERKPRVEHTAAIKLDMALTMLEKAKSGVNEKDWATLAQAKWGMPAYRLKKTMQSSEQWQIRVDELSGVKKTTRIPNGR